MDVEVVDPYISLPECLDVRVWLCMPWSTKEYDDINSTIMDVVYDNVRVPCSVKMFYDLERYRKVVLPI